MPARSASKKHPRKRQQSKAAVKQATHHRENKSEFALFPWQVAEQLLIAERTVYSLIAMGELRGMRIGRGRVIIHKKDLEEYVAKKRGVSA